MKRITMMVDEQLLAELRKIARDEGVSLAEVIREGLDWRARRPGRPPSFIGAVASGERGRDTAAHAHELRTNHSPGADL